VFNRAMHRAGRLVLALALVIPLGAASCRGRLDRGGPTREDVLIAGRIPGTLFLPQPSEGGTAFPGRPPHPERPPAAVLMHAYETDRDSLSGLARALAESGCAALTVDVRDHLRERDPDRRGRPASDFFYANLSAAVDYLRASPRVDGSRIVLMGHSMGARASLDYATRVPGIDGAVMISGALRPEGPHRAPNALFIFASGDHESLRETSRRLAALVAGVPEIELSQTYGKASEGTAVRAVEIPDTDHGTIISSDAAAKEIVAWVEAIFVR
jgi:dienelactone hydrolase